MADEFGHLPRGPGRVLKAAQWSMQGLKACWLHESSFRLEVYLFAILAPLGFWLGQDGVERALLEVYLFLVLAPLAAWLAQTPVERVLLIGSMLLVLSMELLNSAVEAVIERYGPEFHELAGRAKDMGSAAVFVLMVNVLLTWALLLGPRWL